MKIARVLVGLLCCVSAVALAQERDLEARRRLTPEALARYAAPGEASRYVALEEQLKVPLADLGAPALDLRMPVQTYPSGRNRTLVFAKEAWVSPDMMSIRGRHVRVEQLGEDGALEAMLIADEVQVDRVTMLAVARGRVSGSFGSDRLQGQGALMDFNAQYVKLLEEACIFTQRAGEANFTDRGMF